MNNQPPIREQMPSPGWTNWFSQVFRCLPWKQAFNITVTLDFGLVAAQSQASLTATVTGARVGDAVQIATADVSGVVFTGAVTGGDTVTVYAKNFSAAGVNPSSQSFRIIVLQN